ncbi:hypothetical protein CCHL11_09285 [Colletotrichum chlorophyti]|uniref:Uncharacterized protein n=1 Tax=Colletotrichum chlorophyti TaxID=708187 RepID=A0A1Q8RSL0_9PEZI|nr:hypothetical protein CCHL11_09285 [Colletotrichum chlorophyti]
MTFSSPYSMPGTYFDTQPGGVHPGVFRPPTSPSTSSYCFARANGGCRSGATTPLTQPKRKRRTDVSREATPLHEWCDGNMSLDGSTELTKNETPTLNREARYTLAGQLETPGAAPIQPFENGILDDSIYSDADYRRALGSKRPHEEMESPVPGQPTMLVQPSLPVVTGWRSFALSTLGGVVGKVWEFCKAGAFRGFSAGGGKAYTMDGRSLPAPDPRPDVEHEESEKIDAVGQDTPTPILAASPVIDSAQGEFCQPFHLHYNQQTPDLNVPESTPSRPAVKRRQTSAGNHDELRAWVVVDETASGVRPLPRAPMRPVSRSARTSMVTGRRISVPKPRLSSNPIGHRRQSTSRDLSSGGTAPFSYREPASFANVRSMESLTPPTGPSPSRIPVPVQPAGMSANPFARPSSSNRRQSGIPSPVPSNMSPPMHTQRREHVNASAASPRVKQKEFGVDSIRASPRLDAEAKRLAARRARDEQDADARMNDFNQRLKEMIRQGREALGTKIEIDGEEGGWEDD